MSEITYRVRRALSDAELTAITARVERATTLTEIVASVAEAVYSALLATLGESLTDYTADRRLDPRHFAIPQTQWTAITEACLAQADACGGRALIAMELIQVMPASYDDPAVTVTSTPTADRRPYEHVLTVSRDATDAITAASHHCEKLAAWFGPNAREYLDAVSSWQHHLAQIFSMVLGADTRITRDGDLSLLVRSGGGFMYGLIFHPAPRTCTNHGCHAVIRNDGAAWTHRPDDPTCPQDQHTPSYPLNAPQPGTWSFHS